MDRKTVVVAVVSAVLGAVLAAPLAVYASHAFTDVPSSNVFHSSIAWLADAGVTQGCNPPANTKFCPKDEVTREQMAAFMRRFAGFLGAEDGTPALADKATTANSATTAKTADSATALQGYTAQQLAPRVAFNSTNDGPNTSPYTLATTITAPARGTLVIVGGGEVSNLPTNSPDAHSCVLRVNGTIVPGSRRVMETNPDLDVNLEENCATNGAVVVNAGTHTVDITFEHNGQPDIDDASLQVTWVPFNGAGNRP